MNQVNSNEVEVLIIEFKVHVKTTFVTHLLAEENFFTHSTMVGLDNSTKHSLLGLLDESNYKHF